jgi:hypothetical protein
VVLDLLSLTEEAAMWQKSAFAKREEVLVQLQEDFGFAEAHSNEERGSDCRDQELLKVGR